MGKKLLCTLTKSEYFTISGLISNYASLQTARQILLETRQMTEVLEERYSKSIHEKAKKINLFWESITNKYKLPYYPHAYLHISVTTRQVFLTEKDGHDGF